MATRWRSLLRIMGPAGALLVSACTAKSDQHTGSPTVRTAFRPLTVGDSAPAYAALTLAGDSVHIGRAGEPVTVMNIWATWCTSCREEMADLEALHREFAPQGVRVLGVSVDETDVTRVRKFVEQEALTFGIAHDADGRVEGVYQVTGLPQTYVIGRNGRLLWKTAGNVHGVVDSLRATLTAALQP